jgi:hypothetical protein
MYGDNIVLLHEMVLGIRNRMKAVSLSDEQEPEV